MSSTVTGSAIYGKLAPIARAFSSKELHHVGDLAIRNCPTDLLKDILKCSRSCSADEDFPGGIDARELLESRIVSELEKR